MSDQGSFDNDQSKRDVPSFIEPRPPLILNPYMRPRPQMATNLMELFEEDSECEEQDWVQVYLRLKPCNTPSNLYEVRSNRCLITSVDMAPAGHGRRTHHNVSKMYTFSHIFGPDSTQKELFEQVVKSNLKKLPEGHNFTLLTYGASGSGKTYTLMGTVASPGLVPRSLEYVFRLVEAAQQPLFKPMEGGAEKLAYHEQEYELQWVKRLRSVSAPLKDKYRRMSAQLRNDLTTSTFDLSNRTRYYVWVSFIEIYNESIYDLLSNSDRSKSSSKLRIREDSNGHVYVKGATQAFVRTGEEAYDVMVAGKHNLQVAATGVHAQSSRSHCIFTITMLTETESGVRESCVRLCDLAGSERAVRTRNTGARLQESRAINSSLHVLERCLHMLRRKQRRAHLATLVPYRESKLTRLLGAGLCGARLEAVAMVVTLNPAPHFAHETRHVLQLAAVAKDIQVNNTMVVESTFDSSTQDTIAVETAEVVKLRADNERLHFELVQAQSRNKELMASMEEKQQEVATTMYEIVEEAKDLTRQYYEAQMQSLKAEMEEMQEEYESKVKAYQTGDRHNTSDVGTPSRSLQNKVSHLMSVIAVLEEKLMREKMARARAEEEVQHLRACIEERDEKSEDDATNDQEVVLTDSESEDESDVDPANESLEPTFKKEDINRTRLARLSLVSNKNDITQDSVKSDTIHESVLETNDTLKDADSTVKDSTEVSEDESQNKIDTDESIYKSYNTMSSNDKTDRDSETDRNSKDEKSFSKQSNRGTYYVSDGKISDSNNKTDLNSGTDLISEVNKSNRSDRGTYHISNTVDILTEKENIKMTQRGTYFIKDTQNKSNDSFKKNKDSLLDTISYNESQDNNHKRDDSKDNISFKPSFSNDKSLDQFEQLERASEALTVKALNSKAEEQEKPIILDSVKNASKIDKTFNKLQSNEGIISVDQFEKLEKASVNKSIKDSISKIGTAITKETKILVKETRYLVSENVNTKLSSISLKAHDSDVSLAQFEQLEKSAEKCVTKQSLPKLDAFANVKPLKEKRIFFNDNEDDIIFKNEKPQSLIKLPINKEKKTYFDNITTNAQPVLKVSELQKNAYDDRSPSIVKDEGNKDFEPNKIKKLFGESITRTEVINSVTKLSNTLKKQASIDIFESPNIHVKLNENDNVKGTEVEQAFKTENKLNNEPKTTGDNKTELKLQGNKINTTHTQGMDQSFTETLKSEVLVSGNIDLTTSEKTKSLKSEKNKDDSDQKSNTIENVVESIKESIQKMVLDQKTTIDNDKMETENVFKKPMVSVTTSGETQVEGKQNDTVSEFENIYKETTNIRPTEFELLVSQNTSTNANESNEGIECKYNLRHKIDTSIEDKKSKAKENTIPDENKAKEILLESHSTCESKPKRNLRLRRRKNQEDDIQNDSEEKAKLKDIVNLQKEFCDVTLDKPAAKKVVKDIQSPEKKEENHLIMEAQSCPSKSVTRSRRKLFTPLAEPLEESIGPDGDSNERVRVPRPSYHRVRARRKL